MSQACFYRAVSPRDRRSHKEQRGGRGKENEDVADGGSSRMSTSKAASGDDDRHRLRDRKRVIKPVICSNHFSIHNVS